MEDVRGGKADPGNYGRIQNYVAKSSSGKVIYTPPSAIEVPIMMSEMVKWLNADLEIHPVLARGIARFQLVQNLLQAICRTNCIYPGKTHGLILDYLGIFDNVATALDFDEKAL